MKNKNRLIGLTLVTLSLLVYSCSKEEVLDVAPQQNPKTDQKEATGKTTLFKEVSEPEKTANYATEYPYGDTVDMMTFDAAPMMASTSEVKSASSSYPTKENPNSNYAPGVLTAGEWNDLNNWDFWNDLLNDQEYFQEANKWNLESIKRYSFEVKDNNGSFVANAEISLWVGEVEVWKTITDNHGQATLWSGEEFDYITATITIQDQQKTVVDVKEYTKGVNHVTLNKTIVNSQLVDIYFAVDATGSMGDEINYLKTELKNVIENIKQNNPALGMRFGSVFYRDTTDDYVTRDLPFTSDESSLISFIEKQSASGGGDFPEAVHSALDVAITQNSWNEAASTRILFLLLDAPPHYTQESISSLEKSIQLAAEKGIKIIPITASGIDKPTEYLMRSFAILTNGTYVFITDDSGVGNSHIKPTVGDFEVQKLNDLMINLVDNYVR